MVIFYTFWTFCYLIFHFLSTSLNFIWPLPIHNARDNVNFTHGRAAISTLYRHPSTHLYNYSDCTILLSFLASSYFSYIPIVWFFFVFFFLPSAICNIGRVQTAHFHQAYNMMHVIGVVLGIVLRVPTHKLTIWIKICIHICT